MLPSASVLFSDNKYRKIAEGNINFVFKYQQEDGSWLYAADSVREFIDHFHTCFVLKGLAKIEKLINHLGCTTAIRKGVEYYVKNLFGGLALAAGYLWAVVTRMERPVSKELMEFHRREEMEKLRTILKSMVRFKKIDKFRLDPH